MTVATAEVVNYYNKSRARWEKQVGENCHHGYYGPGDPVNPSTLPDSQIRMIDEVLKFAGISDDPLKKPKNIIDVGCAMGGTGRYFVKKFGANCCGIDLTPVQIRRAQELTVAAGLQDKMSFIVGDALDQPFPDGQFDLVWAFDVIDHTPYRLKEFKMANWSEHVTPFWEAINQSYWTLRGLTSLLLSGWDEIKWALALPTVLEAYNKKLISFNVIACRKGE